MTSTSSAAATIVGVDIFGPATRDAKRLIAFYRDVLGMKPTAIDDAMQGAEFELADGTTFGVWQPDEATSGAGYSALFASLRARSGGYADLDLRIRSDFRPL
jgi:catechol 2,3-dioxygenase-like lactoylglutathione lyase family enzyme